MMFLHYWLFDTVGPSQAHIQLVMGHDARNAQEKTCSIASMECLLQQR